MPGVHPSSATPSLITRTTTSTAIISNNPAASPSTVLVTVIITLTPSAAPPPPPKTSTLTQTRTLPPFTDDGLGAPYRPTSLTNTAPKPTGTGTGSYCPTGFYPCLASAGAGCCQTGRDCQTTSCPPPPVMTTIVATDGVTVVVPVGGDSPAATTGQCAGGWFLCGTEAGPVAGCCPSGYECGTASCFVQGQAGETGAVGKVVPGEAAAGGRRGAARGGGVVVVGWVVWGVARGGW